MSGITVFVADDHSVVREGLRQVLSGSGDLEVIGEAADGRSAIREIRRLHPAVAILDISMPVISGLECIPLIKKDAPGTAIVILSMFAKDIYVAEALAAGARGYLLKTDPLNEVAEAVRMVARGRYFLSREINSELIRGKLCSSNGTSPEQDKYAALSPREKQVLGLVITGKTTRYIADTFFISPKTVEKHRANIGKKIGCNEPLDLLKFAMKAGVADFDLWLDS